jgi:hypothetical protein
MLFIIPSLFSQDLEASHNYAVILALAAFSSLPGVLYCHMLGWYIRNKVTILTAVLGKYRSNIRVRIVFNFINTRPPHQPSISSAVIGVTYDQI